MKRTLAIVVIILSMFSTNAFAQETPLDTIVVWFSDSLNQNRQVSAFFTIIESHNYHFTGKMVEVKPEYDSSKVRDAFEVFVRSISINAPVYHPLDFIASQHLATPPVADDTLGQIALENWDSPDILDMDLSLYVNWGFTSDLYEIADILYEPQGIGYYCDVWNEMGIGYFEYIEDQLEADSTEYMGIWKCSQYLARCVDKDTTIETKALEILLDCAASMSPARHRGIVGEGIVQLYMIGYTEVKNTIDSLLVDPVPSVKRKVVWDIQNQQRKNNLLMEFNLGSDE
ncbi:MAG: hypothetical protein P9X24_11930 [Candidatus Hatepunaea meridiana]|nr:hypothetical protein [Candidatus Hatepunaea meridiana]